MELREVADLSRVPDEAEGLSSQASRDHLEKVSAQRILIKQTLGGCFRPSQPAAAGGSTTSYLNGNQIMSSQVAS